MAKNGGKRLMAEEESEQILMKYPYTDEVQEEVDLYYLEIVEQYYLQSGKSRSELHVNDAMVQFASELNISTNTNQRNKTPDPWYLQAIIPLSNKSITYSYRRVATRMADKIYPDDKVNHERFRQAGIRYFSDAKERGIDIIGGLNSGSYKTINRLVAILREGGLTITQKEMGKLMAWKMERGSFSQEMVAQIEKNKNGETYKITEEQLDAYIDLFELEGANESAVRALWEGKRFTYQEHVSRQDEIDDKIWKAIEKWKDVNKAEFVRAEAKIEKQDSVTGNDKKEPKEKEKGIRKKTPSTEEKLQTEAQKIEKRAVVKKKTFLPVLNAVEETEEKSHLQIFLKKKLADAGMKTTAEVVNKSKKLVKDKEKPLNNIFTERLFYGGVLPASAKKDLKNSYELKLLAKCLKLKGESNDEYYKLLQQQRDKTSDPLER